MTLIRKNTVPSLFSDGWLTDFFDNERFFDADWMKRPQVIPAVNVVENDNSFEIEMAAPGLSKNDFNITIENGVLTISSEKEFENVENEKNYTRKEYSYTNFTRSFTLPETVKTDKIDARYDNGVLKIMVPKLTEAKVKPKAIEVH